MTPPRSTALQDEWLEFWEQRELPFLHASFDLVVCRGAMHHFLHPERPIAEMARVCRPEGRVVVSDMVATSTEARERFDQLHRDLDPSHNRTLLEAEVAELLRSTVGPIAYGETSDPFAIPVDHILTDAADRDAVVSALRAELAGGDTTGFDPVADGDQILVSFTSTVVHATRSSA